MSNKRTLIGLLIIFFGVSALFGFPFFKIVFALFVIYIGISIMTDHQFGFQGFKKTKVSENIVKKVVIGSGISESIESANFQKAELVVILGGGEIDFRHAKTSLDEITIDVVAILGGLKVYVPENWIVVSEGVGIIGAMNNQTKRPAKSGPKLLLKGVAIMGGVDVVNS